MTEPIATGTLSKTPLPHLLVYLEQKKLSGTLAVWPDDAENAKGQDRILMLKGRPVAGRLLAQAPSLREGLLPLFSRESAPYAFYDENLLGPDRLNGRIDPFALITESLRTMARADVVTEVLARFTGKKIRMLQGVELDRYEFAPEERAVVQLLQAEPASLESLVAGTSLDDERARRVLYVLAITKAVGVAKAAEGGDATAKTAKAAPEPAAEPAAEAPASAASPADADEAAPAPDDPRMDRLDRLAAIPGPPKDLQGELRERWQAVVTRARLIEGQNYFEMLGIDKKSKPADARTAFFKLAKEWHPDRLPKELAALKPYADIMFGYFSEAHTTLTSDDDRKQYLDNLREGGGTPRSDRMMQRILEAAMSFERVLVLARTRDYDSALRLLEDILEVAPDEPQYLAMKAQILLELHKGDDAPLQEMLDLIDRSLKGDADSEKANLTKAHILQRTGQNELALSYFRKVAEINPRNIEAAREVRVANMRKSPAKSGGKKEPAGGVFGKLFRKK